MIDLRIYWMTDIHLVDEWTGRPEAPGAVWMERHSEVRALQSGLTFINGVAMIAGTTSSVNIIELVPDGTYRLDYRQVGFEVTSTS
ncbi:hypothetical protein [Paenibacillus sp. J2TS4]|uniref:hypothetical protein n=1 Tax=Paenibacillus sp. J2TS4 TaxID=2807194 RepID=UPI001B27B639|nr:hypothetical protein [Paenibacillus sp. J2TS4]GIP36137.1 hypothetical protein J2TS4_53470 [Paenibacillus sp. J2TS4]